MVALYALWYNFVRIHKALRSRAISVRYPESSTAYWENHRAVATSRGAHCEYLAVVDTGKAPMIGRDQSDFEDSGLP
jgi:hypothetical protein